jgi:hypothetical protein
LWDRGKAKGERNYHHELRHRHCTMGIEIVDAAKVGITCMNEASVLFKHLRRRASIVWFSVCVCVCVWLCMCTGHTPSGASASRSLEHGLVCAQPRRQNP